MLLCPPDLAIIEAGVLGPLQSGTAEIPCFLIAVHPLIAEAKE